MGTSTSFKEGFDAFEGKERAPEELSPPKADYVKWATRTVNIDQQSPEEKILDFLTSWRHLNGDKTPFDEELYRRIAKESFSRTTLHNPYLNHALAMQASYDKHKDAPGLIEAPTLILHGTEDPVFGIDHAESLNRQIKGSTLISIDGMGHNLNTKFFEKIISLIKGHIKQSLLAKSMQHERAGSTLK
jgi:pimeloyl-ACP methyl ester carboxylesterase